MDFFKSENIAWMMDNLDEARYGVRPRGTKREQVLRLDETKTVEELAYSELLGKDVKILKK